MRQLLAIFAAALCLIRIATAGIGETERQILGRYGEPITVLQNRVDGAGLTKCYVSNGFLVAVTFLNGRSVREMITKPDNSRLTETEILKLLHAPVEGRSVDAAGLTGPRMVTPGVQEWRSLDQRSRVAFYDSHTRALFITTQKFIDLTNANKRAVAIRSDAGGLGARGRSDLNLRALQKENAIALRRGQSQPAATPAK